MPYTEAQLSNIVKKAMTEWTWTDKVQPGNTGVPGSSWRNNTLWTIVYLEQLLGIVRELAAKAGVDVDESAIASQVAASIAPALREALVEAVQTGGTPEAIADAVVAKLGAALAPTA